MMADSDTTNTAAGGEPLIRIDDLRVEFRMREGTVEALKGVDLQIRPGEVLGLVGESGSGKSVTAQAILRIIPKGGAIAGGTIMYNRKAPLGINPVNIASLPPKGDTMKQIRRNEISIIFQEPMTALSPVHTIGNQIMEVLRLQRPISEEEARHETVSMLSRVGIPKPETRLDTYTFQLSGGMRQRAMIAMALVKRPSLLIADEPTTALDVTTQAQILRLLADLQAEMAMAVLCITHNMGVVAALAQRVAVMYWGRVVEEGPVEAIFNEPRHPYTQGLIRSIPKIARSGREKLWSVKGVVPHPYARIPGCHFAPRCPHAMVGKCDVKYPERVEVGAGHTVRCFLYGGDGADA